MENADRSATEYGAFVWKHKANGTLPAKHTRKQRTLNGKQPKYSVMLHKCTYNIGQNDYNIINVFASENRWLENFCLNKFTDFQHALVAIFVSHCSVNLFN